MEGVWNNATERKVRELSRKLDELLLREEIMWKQRSRMAWLREGDRNTRYFHRKAMWRQKKNTVSKNRDESGSWVNDSDKMKAMAAQFFMDLYREDPEVDPSTILNFVKCRVTVDMNVSLTKNITNEEIADVVFQIGPMKAPGPDA